MRNQIPKYKMSIITKCAYCGKYSIRLKVSAIRSKNNFCSQDCQSKWTSENRRGENHPQYEGTTFICELCGKEYKKSKAWKDITKYCSRKCTDKAWKKQIKTKCSYCDKEILVQKNRYEKGDYNYCNIECSNNDRGNRLRNSDARKKGENYNCLQCGDIVYRTPSEIVKNPTDNVFCSRECDSEWKSENIRGEKRWNWKGGVTELRHSIRSLRKYKQWRTSVFERDDYTCQDCGVRGGYLQADHMDRFADILDRNNIKSKEEAELCDELWNIDNGQTLCLDCHKKKTYKKTA